MLDAMALFDQHRSIKQGKLNVRLGSEFSGFSAPGKLHEFWTQILANNCRIAANRSKRFQ